MEYSGLNCHYLRSALNGACCGASHKTVILYLLAAEYMAVPIPTAGAKYGGHKRHFISQITTVFNIFFCSVHFIPYFVFMFGYRPYVNRIFI